MHPGRRRHRFIVDGGVLRGCRHVFVAPVIVLRRLLGHRHRLIRLHVKLVIDCGGGAKQAWHRGLGGRSGEPPNQENFTPLLILGKSLFRRTELAVTKPLVTSHLRGLADVDDCLRSFVLPLHFDQPSLESFVGAGIDAAHFVVHFRQLVLIALFRQRLKLHLEQPNFLCVILDGPVGELSLQLDGRVLLFLHFLLLLNPLAFGVG
mmetsp:Transcript_7488/g.19260  ORF Transcript_7488/g.19260 Transcript_7488/m.19260 type:complete len:206 (-) Transcript_7488:71-688(-)